MIYQHLKSNGLVDTLMFFFSEADKSIINHYHEKGYTAYKIWNENTEKHLDKTLVKRL